MDGSRAERQTVDKGTARQYHPVSKQGIAPKLIGREAKRAEGKGIGYDRWTAVYNLDKLKMLKITLAQKKELQKIC